MIKKRLVERSLLPKEKTILAQSIQDHLIMVYGPPGIGKTTFVNNLSDRTLFLSTDRGTRYLSALRVEINSYKDLIGTLSALEKSEARNYDIICLDHVDDIAMILEEHVCLELGIEGLGDLEYGKGWKMFKKELFAMLQRLLRLPCGIVFIAHESIKTIRTKIVETERTMPDIGRTPWKIIVPACDLVGYCGFHTIKKGGKRGQERVIRTAPLESIYAKDRTSRIKPSEGYELLDGKQFLKSFKKGSRHVESKSKKVKKSSRRTTR